MDYCPVRGSHTVSSVYNYGNPADKSNGSQPEKDLVFFVNFTKKSPKSIEICFQLIQSHLKSSRWLLQKKPKKKTNSYLLTLMAAKPAVRLQAGK